MAVRVANLKEFRAGLSDFCRGLVAGEWRSVSEAIENLRLGNFQPIRDQSDAVSRWRPIASPGVDSQMMMVARRGKEQRPWIGTLRHRQAEKFMIEPLGRGQACHMQVNVAEVSLWRNMRGRRLAFSQGEEVLHIQRAGCHGDLIVAPDPLRARTICIKLDAVVIRITQINRFAHLMVRSALDWIVAS